MVKTGHAPLALLLSSSAKPSQSGVSAGAAGAPKNEGRSPEAAAAGVRSPGGKRNRLVPKVSLTGSKLPTW